MHAPRSVRAARPAYAAIGLTAALTAAVWFQAGRGAALPGPDESTFVPIVPCRLMDTRADAAFNVGPRDTPLGEGETHRLAVTGQQGACQVPDDASAVALNVTAVSPTAASFLTLFPYETEPPNASNLNFTAGAPATPNKVDVRLSDTGELGVYNAFGQVDVVIDVTGYYTAAGLADLVAALGTKADADDVYDTATIDAALADLADDVAGLASTVAGLVESADMYTKDEVYSKDEIEARTQRRTMSFPVGALNVPDHGALDTATGSLIWGFDPTAVVNLPIARPADWVEGTPITLRIQYQRTPSGGDVIFRVATVAADAGEDLGGLLVGEDTVPQSESGPSGTVREAQITLGNTLLEGGAWWFFAFHRPNIPANTYTDPLYVNSVSIEYDAHT